VTDHRPRAHLRPATGWTNDPIGPVFWGGRTHLFHQANPDGGYWDRPHWGHLVTDDLVHWQRRPLALSPDLDPAAVDADGCYSGCVVVDGDEAVLFYTGVKGPEGAGQVQATCIARSRDPQLDRWDKDPSNPVTVAPVDQDLVGFRDPFVWRAHDRWWQLVGAGNEEVGGAAWLFSSTELTDWVDEGPMLTSVDLTSDPATSAEWTGSMWECPALARTPHGDVLLLSVHDGRDTHHPVAVVGALEGTRFVARSIQRIDLGPDMYAPCLYAAPDGRLLVWGWSWEARTSARQRSEGWAGVLTFPRELRLEGDRVGFRPIVEVERLRGSPLSIEPSATPDGRYLGDLAASQNVVDLEVALGPAADVVELRLCRSPELDEVTTLRVDRHRGELWLDRDRASLDPDATGGRVGGEVDLAPGRPTQLRIVLDRSIVEVFVDDRTALTARVYPTRPDSTGLEVVASGQALDDVTVRAWSLGSIWRDPETT
jgi:beta-fructofuranosidase